MRAYLPVGGAVGLDGPSGLVAKGFEDFVVVAVLGELVVSVHSQSGENLRRDGPPPPLSPLVVLPLLPCRQPRPRRHSDHPPPPKATPFPPPNPTNPTKTTPSSTTTTTLNPLISSPYLAIITNTSDASRKKIQKLALEEERSDLCPRRRSSCSRRSAGEGVKWEIRVIMRWADECTNGGICVEWSAKYIRALQLPSCSR